MVIKRLSSTTQDFEQILDWLQTNFPGLNGENFEKHEFEGELYYINSKWSVCFIRGCIAVWVDGRCLHGNKRVEFMLRWG